MFWSVNVQINNGYAIHTWNFVVVSHSETKAKWVAFNYAKSSLGDGEYVLVNSMCATQLIPNKVGILSATFI